MTTERHQAERHQDLTASSMTIQSDSENYGNNEGSPSPPSSSSAPIVIYKSHTIWSLCRGAAINLLLPFVNGLMLGFGELFAHEIAFRLGWSNTKVCQAFVSKFQVRTLYLTRAKVLPSGRIRRPVGPGIEVQSDPVEEQRRKGYLDDMTSLE